jgi:5-methylcytosine-specific restriction endonuclease McrA
MSVKESHQGNVEVDKRRQHRALLKAVADGTAAFVFYSRKLRDDEPRNCQFCGEIFLPGQQPGLETPMGPAHWLRTLCSDDCQAFRSELRRREQRSSAIKKGSVPGIKIDRSAVLERDNYVCYLCGGHTIKGYRGPDRKLRPEMDHVIPLGTGLHHPDNLRCCCSRCNLEKGSKTLEQAIRISSCGNIDFDDLALIETRATLGELASAWKQWVLPGIDEDAEMRGYADQIFQERWTDIYRKRISRLEELVSLEPGNDKHMDALSLAYIGQSNFLKQYGHQKQAEEVLRKRLEICKRLMVQQPTGIRFLDAAVCLFDMTKVGADSVSELERLRRVFSVDAISYISQAIIHMSDIAQRRKAALNK